MRTRTKLQGIIFVVALLAMLGMVLMGTALISASIQQYNDARRDLNNLSAIANADAGMNYFVWKQKYSSSSVTTFYTSLGNVYNLTPGGTPAPQIPTSAVTFGENKAAVWVFTYRPIGATNDSYQVIAKGYCRNAIHTVRAVVQGAINSQNTTPPAWMNYALYTDSAMTLNSSTDIHGDIGSNGSIILNLSGGGGIYGNVHGATTVTIGKNATDVTGNLNYGTKVLDDKGRDITNQADQYCSGSASQLPADQRTIPLPGMDPQVYYNWASLYGNAAMFTGNTISSPSQITTPIIFCNPSKTPGYTLNITCALPSTVTIFVNGDVSMTANIGTVAHPVAVLATGNMNISNGNPVYSGIFWANGSFGGTHPGNGTPTINGSLRCTNMSYQGNPQMNWMTFSPTLVNPPSSVAATWSVGSWQLL